MRASSCTIFVLVAVVLGLTACGTTPEPAPGGSPDPAPDGSAAAGDTGDNEATDRDPDAAPPIVQPGAPGEPSRVITAERAAEVVGAEATAGDVRFMQDMIHHHAQALDMTALVEERSEREDMRLLALRIELSQEDEIGMMQRWLELRGEEIPQVHDHHVPGAPLMPGMLTAEEMDRLRRARGEEFERLFLQGMIKHHQGALVMVEELFATPGAGQETNVFAFASEVLADQAAEIDRMGAMLAAMR